jgi:DNA-binding transcriptional LysR family regulator
MALNPWLGVEIRHLAALQAIATAGSFRAAADDLGYVQSAISQQLQRLESLVGFRLIERERGTGPVEVTEAGRALLGHASAIIARLDAAQADLRAIAEGRTGTVRIGISEPFGGSLLGPILRARPPSLTVAPKEFLDEQTCVQLVSDGTLDVALATLPLPGGALSYQQLCADATMLVVPADSPIATNPEPSIALLEGLRLIRHERWRMTDLIANDLRAAGVDPCFAISAGTTSTILSLIAEGLGAAILPKLSLATNSSPGVAVIDLGGQLPGSTIVACWHRDREHAQCHHEFVAAARSACGALSPPPDTVDPEPAIALAA